MGVSWQYNLSASVLLACWFKGCFGRVSISAHRRKHPLGAVAGPGDESYLPFYNESSSCWIKVASWSIDIDEPVPPHQWDLSGTTDMYIYYNIGMREEASLLFLC